MRILAAAVVFSSALGAFFSAEASACSPQLCTTPVRLFGSEAIVPGNLVYFQVLASEPGPLVLEQLDGTPVSASIRLIGSDRVFAPDEALAPDKEFRLTYQSLCGGSEPQDTSYEFTTMSQGAIELRPAELELVETGIFAPEKAEQRGVFARLRFYSPDATGFAAHLVDHQVTIDDRPTGFNGDFRDAQTYLDVRTRCGAATAEWLSDSCGIVHEAPEGPHEVSVTTHVVGAEVQPAFVSRVVETSCDSEESSGEESAKTQANDEVSAAPVAQGGANCRVSPGSSAFVAAMATLAFTIAVLITRRRQVVGSVATDRV